MSELSESSEYKIKNLIHHFLDNLPVRLIEISQSVSLITESEDTYDKEKVRELLFTIHKMRGGAVNLCMDSFNQVLRTLEDKLKELLENSEYLSESMKIQIEEAFLDIKTESERQELDNVYSHFLLENPDLVKMMDKSGDERIIFLYESGSDINDMISQPLNLFGFHLVKTEKSDIDASLFTHCDNPVLIVMAEDNIKDESLQYRLEDLKKSYGDQILLIFVSYEGGFSTRLQSVRSHGDAFFQLPLDMSDLVDKIDDFHNRQDSDPFHVLIVDDDFDQISYHAFILQQEGMITSVATDPKQVLKVIVESRPDLILMDLYMPGCTGFDLVRVIRQQEAFLSIPIIFLSIEDDDEVKLEAVRLGSDDFLTKPVKKDHFITMVKMRASRMRDVRFFMERDSLTGFLNHSHIKESLPRELSRADRMNSSVCFVMIDIDNFKEVNDSYGHLAGDSALKSLSRLLRDRLRNTDLIGRYGGDEFAVIMTNTSLEDGIRIMDTLRESFHEVPQRSGGNEFFLTFSCGIACSSPDLNVAEWTDLADKALYEAKKRNRNCVVSSSMI